MPSSLLSVGRFRWSGRLAWSGGHRGGGAQGRPCPADCPPSGRRRRPVGRDRAAAGGVTRPTRPRHPAETTDRHDEPDRTRQRRMDKLTGTVGLRTQGGPGPGARRSGPGGTKVRGSRWPGWRSATGGSAAVVGWPVPAGREASAPPARKPSATCVAPPPTPAPSCEPPPGRAHLPVGPHPPGADRPGPASEPPGDGGDATPGREPHLRRGLPPDRELYRRRRPTTPWVVVRDARSQR